MRHGRDRRVLRGRSADDRKLATLAACPLTDRWTHDELLWLGRVAEVLDLAPGAGVPAEGRLRWRYVVATGVLAVERQDGEVRVITGGVLDAARCRSITAMSEARLLVVPPQEARQLAAIVATARRRRRAGGRET